MKIKFIIAFLFMALNLSAHSILMSVMDNEDGTITIIGEFNTGEKTVGAQVRLESLVSGEVLYKKRLPEESEITVDIPKEEYQIVLDGGPGHTIVKEGVEPEGGFTKKAKEGASKSLSKHTQGGMVSTPVIVLFSLAFLFIALALYFSARNTKILMEQLKANQKS